MRLSVRAAIHFHIDLPGSVQRANSYEARQFVSDCAARLARCSELWQVNRTAALEHDTPAIPYPYMTVSYDVVEVPLGRTST